MGGFEVVHEIHRGGRFVVARARADGGAPVVLKSARPDLGGTDGAIRRLANEYTLLRRLALPGVVTTRGLLEIEGRPTLVLADAGPSNLTEWQRRRPLATAELVPLAIAITEALAGLHQAGVIHRDLCPQNLVLSGSAVTIVDLDAASRLPAGGGLAPQMWTTPAYLAPEETGRLDRLVDARADLYSLGAVLYELATGVPPFGSGDALELVHAHLSRTPVPPLALAPALPEVLSQIVLRLLAKSPEARYGSAAALLVDLREAGARLYDGAIPPFELGRADSARELPLPDKLYQREGETAQLLSAVRAVDAGESRVVVLRGEAGAGKSALATNLLDPVAERGGRFVAGKFDLAEGMAHPAIAAALRLLIEGELAAEAARTSDRAAPPSFALRIATALGPNLRLAAELSPALAAQLGETPALAPLAPFESARRFEQAMITVLRASAAPSRPLVLLLDDLQWADAASLRLVLALARAAVPHLLLLLTYRDDPAPLALAGFARELAAGTALVEQIAVAPLGEVGVAELCRDLLRVPPERAIELGRLLLRKSGGNPFFLRRLLRHLHEAGWLRWRPERDGWDFDLGSLDRLAIAANVIDLLTAAVERLPAPALRVLSVAAAHGPKLSRELLAEVAGLPPGELDEAIGLVLQQGYFMPRAHAGSAAELGFVHDRVREAVYARLSPAEATALHLAIGRALRAADDPTRLSGERLFQVVDQLDRGVALVSDPEARRELGELNLLAARAARARAAFGAALAYLEQAEALLGEGAGEVGFRIARDAMECAAVEGDIATTARSFVTARARARTLGEQAELYCIHVAASVNRSAIAEAIRWATEGLALFGIELGRPDVAATTKRELTAIEARIAGRPPEALLAEPPMRDEISLAATQLLAAVLGATFTGRPDLFPYVVARMISLSLAQGHAPHSGIAFVFYALIVQRTSNDLARAHAFGKLGVELARRSGDPAQECCALAVFSTLVNNWVAPLAATVPLIREAQQCAIASGELRYGVGCASSAVSILYHQGLELTRVLNEIDAAEALARQTNLLANLESLLPYRQAIRCLQGLTPKRRFFDSELDERTHAERLRDNPMHAAQSAIRRLECAFLFGELPRARELAGLAQAGLGSTHFVCQVEHTFYSALTLAGLATPAAGLERLEAIAAITPLFDQLGRWVALAPQNHVQKRQLVAAELARLGERAAEAGELYDQAIATAARVELVQDEAIASELAGRFHRAQGRRRFARLYLCAAVDAYERWGARAKVEALLAEFPDLASDEAGHGRITPPGELADGGGSAVDQLLLLRASEAISGEVVFERLLGKLMEVTLATGGADRGAFVLGEDGRMFVRAVGGVNGGITTQRLPLEASNDVPRRVIEEALRAGAPIVVADATHHVDFARDPYVLEHGLASLLALPVRRKGVSVGVLYLENRLVTGVFTAARVRVLRLLSAQIAISIENSLLFEGMNREIEERKRAEDALRFLADAGAALVESIDYRATLARVARLAVGTLADWCVIDVYEEGVLRRMAAAHRDPSREPYLHQMRAHIDRHGPPKTGAIVAHGAPVLLNDLSEATLRGHVHDEEGMRLIRLVGAGSAMLVPLMAGERSLGVITLVATRAEHVYGAADLALAGELARRAAGAIENARLYREAQEAIRLRDDFLSIASHELNTPIASLQLAAQTLEEMSGGAPDDVLKLAQIVSRQGRRIGALVAQLLDVTRIRSGDLRLRRESVDLSRVVHDTVERLAADIARARCLVEVEAPVAVIGQWDRLRLDQVLNQLLGNAIKFSRGNPILVSASLADGHARLVVEDHGIGIPRERLPHIFGRFERAVSAAHYGGLGLGLFLVHEIVAALGGTIRVDSEVNVGSRFCIELPLAAENMVATELETPAVREVEARAERAPLTGGNGPAHASRRS